MGPSVTLHCFCPITVGRKAAFYLMHELCFVIWVTCARNIYDLWFHNRFIDWSSPADGIVY